MKGGMSRKKDAHKGICRNSTEENKKRHKSMKNTITDIIGMIHGKLVDE